MPTGQRITPEAKLSVLEDLMAGQDSHKGIAVNHKLSEITVTKLARQLAKRKNGTTLRQLAGLNGDISKSAAPKKEKSKYKYAHLFSRMDRLKTSGWTVLEIAQHLKVPRSAVNYYLYFIKAGHVPPSATKKARHAQYVARTKKTPTASPYEALLANLDEQIKKLQIFHAAVREFIG